MPVKMQQIDLQQLVDAFQRLGLHSGSGLLVHSALQFLGQPVGGPELYLQAFDEVIGIPGLAYKTKNVHPKTGTLVVPTFNFNFAHGEPFDPCTTPSQGMGIFSEFIRNYPGARRTPHPMQSLAVLGYYAEDLTSRDTPSSFDPGSAFERMLELDFDILLLGADVMAISMLHYSEQRLQVPYRYWKDFEGDVNTSSGWERRTYRMYVRDLEIDPHLDLHPVKKQLETNNQWWSVPFNYGYIERCRMVDFVKTVEEFLTHDPWSLVTNPPTDQIRFKTDY